MDIADEDVRIKEADSTPVSSVSDKVNPFTFQKADSFSTERSQRSKDNNAETMQEQKKLHSSSSYKRKNFSRSQSVSAPKTAASKVETNFSYRCT